MLVPKVILATYLGALVQAADVDTITPAPVLAARQATPTGQTTAVTNCHAHGDETYCDDGDGNHVLISFEATPTGEAPAEYTDCHAHGSETYCVDPDGNDVLVVNEDAEENDHSLDDSSSSEGQNCHFHAGREHCVGAGESESGATRDCSIQIRDYDVPLRVGTLFAMLATSAVAVFVPIFLNKLPFRAINNYVFTGIKQFGTGIIISTGFVHLYTHAYLMLTDPCIGTIEYEATTSALVMGGLFISFIIEYLGHRYTIARSRRKGADALAPSSSQGSSDPKDTPPMEATAAEQHPQSNLVSLGHHHHHHSANDPSDPNSKLSVMVMEAGILFHSILIGITLVVAGDSFYRTLLVVIIFHQMFEGLALGARIALIHAERLWPTKILMGLAFAVITPLGMGIGIGVLNQFNGGDPTTLWVIGTLNALSAGVLIWVGLVDMWARDWVIEGGDMVHAGPLKAVIGILSLIAGLVVMSVLGKWA